jgi:DNA polymerase-3 subunit beta
MKFKINRDHFANGLAQVLNVVGSKATSGSGAKSRPT